jgi:hypothetical protein
MTKNDMKTLILNWTRVRLDKLTHKQLRELVIKNECIQRN